MTGAGSISVVDRAAPIAVFVYRRPAHTRRMLASLLANPEARDAAITVYCDGPRGDDDERDVIATRNVIHEMVPADARVVFRKSNLGLAGSVIEGVTEQCGEYGRVVVVEDDLVLSPAAIRYFNAALNAYRDVNRVMHIAGYMFPVRRRLPPSFFYRETSCWGWATWRRAWDRFEPDVSIIQDNLLKRSLVRSFDIRGSGHYWEMLEMQRRGELDSWAVRWYGSVFMHGGLALHPSRPLVQNEGFDGTGVHCIETAAFDVEIADEIPEFPERIEECEDAVLAMIDYRNRTQNVPHAPSVSRRILDCFRRRVRRSPPTNIE